MTSFMRRAADDPVRPDTTTAITITVDGQAYEGVRGQTLAGVILANGRTSWRRTSAHGAPRGLFCGIGVCFDCIATVDGERDVRLCQRLARDGDSVQTQHDRLPCPAESRGEAADD